MSNGEWPADRESLIRDAQSGDREAQEQLFRDLEGYIEVVARQFFNRQLQAKLGQSDVAQQAMMKAAEKFSEFRGSTVPELKSWLKRILHNEARQSERELLSQKRDVRKEIRGAAKSGSATDWLANLSDQVPSPRTQAMDEEQITHVKSALESLTEEQRQVIRLRNEQGLSFREVAERMGKSESSATRLWFRALVELQREIERSE